MKAFQKKVTFGVIIGSRAFFNGAMALGARKDLLAQLDRLEIGYHILSADATRNGAVETPEDVRKYVKLFREHRDEIDGLLVILPNFGDEIAVAETIRQSALNVPVLVQACDDEISKVDLAGRRDAFCGKLSVCNNLYQYGIPFTDTALHTCDLDSDVFGADLDRFARICRTVRGLRNARIGAIGARTAPFQTVRFSEKLLQASGITVVTVDLSEILAAAHAIREDDPDVKKRLAEVEAYGRIPPAIPREKILKQARLGIAVDRWMARNECDASAIQCWGSVQENYGCATCLSMSMMSEHLMPSACETDVAGAISMYALTLAAAAPAALLDWNNNYGKEVDKCVCTHCGNFPKSFMGTEPEISNLDVLGTELGPEKCFGAVKGKVAPGPMTYFRISTDDTRGQIKGYIGEGEFTADPFEMAGGIAVTRVRRLRRLLAHLCREGFEHHVAMVRGSWAGALAEATRYLGWNMYQHGVEEP
ncbi:L-fucose/L-arabinose isomerase family protein [Sorangium sp. So ce1389]|uniref:L-fucose/L-arabinose isomerase family protein n=1 Tax=Sorangium sp. So ce1389 TaxID=3133336 RepID=UPI003F638C43